jgi:hypothetical protein
MTADIVSLFADTHCQSCKMLLQCPWQGINSVASVYSLFATRPANTRGPGITSLRVSDVFFCSIIENESVGGQNHPRVVKLNRLRETHGCLDVLG